MKRNIKITRIYYAMVAIIIIMAIVLTHSMSESSRSLNELQTNTETYIEVQDSISSMREASDYLTDMARTYIVTGHKTNLLNYFEEINVIRRRDRALEVITEYNESEYIQQSLEKSLEYSNELAEIEIYAMKMATEGHHVNDPAVNEWLQGIELTKEDAALSDAKKIDKATKMVFDDTYESYKTEIRQGVYTGLDNLVKDTKSDQLSSYARASNISNRQNVLFFIMLFLTALMLLITAMGVIIPINKSIDYIQRNEPIPLSGSAEYNFLAETFNRMIEKNKKHSEMLSYEATHDELTGLYNRKAFENKRDEIQEQDSALILIDVDYFKGINDTYGHETGDEILKKVASAIAGSFRNEDYACRIGGDEFAVLMVQMKPELKSVIDRKIKMLRDKLQVEDGLPQVTLSIGAAFSSDTESHEDLFRNADTALYRVKNAGRNGFGFFK